MIFAHSPWWSLSVPPLTKRTVMHLSSQFFSSSLQSNSPPMKPKEKIMKGIYRLVLVISSLCFLLPTYNYQPASSFSLHAQKILTRTTKQKRLYSPYHYKPNKTNNILYSSTKQNQDKDNKDKTQELFPSVSPISETDLTSLSEAKIADDDFSDVELSLSKQQLNQQSQIKSILKEKLFLGIDPSPDIIAIMTIYFVEGALGLARLAQTFLLKDELHLGPAELSALSGLFTLPWTIKPIYGFLSDAFPLFGYRRRSYLVLCGLLGSFSYLALGFNFWGLFGGESGDLLSLDSLYLQCTIAALILSSATIAFSDVVADGIVVQKTRDASESSSNNNNNVAGGLQSLCWGSASIGALLSAYFSGSILEKMGPQFVFQITAVLPIIVALIAFQIQEEKDEPLPQSIVQEQVDDSSSLVAVSPDDSQSQIDSIKQQLSSLKTAIQNPQVWKPALFLFLWQSTPTGEGAMLYFMTNDLGMGPEFLGRVRLVTALSSLFGVWLYQKYLRKIAIKDILFWSSIISTPLGLSQLILISHYNRVIGIPDSWFVFGDDVALSILGEIAFLPTLVLAAKICPIGVEAVLFASLMSINNGAGTIGTEIGALLTKTLGVTESNFENLGLLNIICNVSSLYPLLFLNTLLGGEDSVANESEESMEKKETEEKE